MKKIYCLLMLSMFFVACDNNKKEGDNNPYDYATELVGTWKNLDSTISDEYDAIHGTGGAWPEYIRFRLSSDNDGSIYRRGRYYDGEWLGHWGGNITEPGKLKMGGQYYYNYSIESDQLTLVCIKIIVDDPIGFFTSFDTEGAVYKYKRIDDLD